MNIQLLIAMLCGTLSLFGQAASPRQAFVEATYSVQLHMKNDRPTMPELQKVADILDNVEVVLLCNNTTSYSFIPYPFDVRDLTEELARVILRADYAYYTDIAIDSHVMEVSKQDARVFVEVDTRILWTITDTVAVINDIPCIYATGVIPSTIAGFKDEKVSAWFTSEYPLPFGPQGLYGLPGLIVQANRMGNIYALKRIRNVSAIQVNVPSPGKGKRIKYAEFFKK